MNTFPSPLADWALQEAEATVNSSRIMSKRVPINIPVDKIGSQIAKVYSIRAVNPYFTLLGPFIIQKGWYVTHWLTPLPPESVT